MRLCRTLCSILHIISLNCIHAWSRYNYWVGLGVGMRISFPAHRISVLCVETWYVKYWNLFSSPTSIVVRLRLPLHMVYKFFDEFSSAGVSCVTKKNADISIRCLWPSHWNPCLGLGHARIQKSLSRFKFGSRAFDFCPIYWSNHYKGATERSYCLKMLTR
ncbi:hypothetical protein C8R44DRAFT_320017 [Mycena epipterygia]|nr:hypothetical protein C8R44DRAFT_320017 [Mycena epipterygia]